MFTPAAAISGYGESACTAYLDLTIGAVRSYGYGNLEMLSCGEDPNSWLYYFDTTASQSMGAMSRSNMTKDGATKTSADLSAEAHAEHEHGHEVPNGHQSDDPRNGANLHASASEGDGTYVDEKSRVALIRKNAVTLRTKMTEGQLFSPLELRAVDPLSGYASPISDSGQMGSGVNDAASGRRTRVQMGHLISRCRVSKATVMWDHVSVEFLHEVVSILRAT